LRHSRPITQTLSSLTNNFLNTLSVQDTWCVFDAFVVAVSIVGVVIDFATTSNLPFLPLLRMLRVARMFRLIPRARGLNVLMKTLVFSIPALANVGSVLFLFLFVFAVVGMNLFGSVKPGVYLGDNANFHNVGRALLTLFRMMTGESWNGGRGLVVGAGGEPHALAGAAWLLARQAARFRLRLLKRAGSALGRLWLAQVCLTSSHPWPVPALFSPLPQASWWTAWCASNASSSSVTSPAAPSTRRPEPRHHLRPC
jgi:hypothetical protein